MRVLTVYAHPNPRSFCHAVLEQFTAGLHDGDHTVDVVDLYAIKFDPVFRMRDMATYLHEDMPPEILEGMNLRQRLLENVPGGPVGRIVASRWTRGKTPAQIAKFIREHAPRDAREQWEKIEGRVPLMHREDALVMTTTLFCEADYEADWKEPMTRIIDDWGLRYPGVKHVEHIYFYEAAIAEPPKLREYLRRAYTLGKDFADVGIGVQTPATFDAVPVGGRG
jgi:NAD(P)H dehydrogenase (quinone)